MSHHPAHPDPGNRQRALKYAAQRVGTSIMSIPFDRRRLVESLLIAATDEERLEYRAFLDELIGV